MRILFALVFASFTLAGCTRAECDTEKLTSTAAAFDTMSADQASAFAVEALTTLCPEPTTLSRSLSGVAKVAPEFRMRTLAEAITENSGWWSKGCKGGTDVLEKMGQVSLEERRELLWTGCGLDRYGFATRADWDDAVLGTVAIMYAPVLTDAKVPAAVRDRYLRALLGKVKPAK